MAAGQIESENQLKTEYNDETISLSSDITSNSSNIDDELIPDEVKQEEARIKNENFEKIKLERNKAKLERKKALDEELQRDRKAKAVKAMSYLLDQSKIYTDFIAKKLKADQEKKERSEFYRHRFGKDRKVANEVLKNTSNERKRKYTEDILNTQMDEFDKLKQSRRADKVKTEVKLEKVSSTEIPVYFEGGTLRPYQLEGLEWMKLLFENGINGILADEMGLGKTVQVIALICHLMEAGINGPFLIVAPLSTIPNWMSEFKRFAPKIPVILFHGSQETRCQLYKKIKTTYTLNQQKVHPVVVTTFQVPLAESKFLRNFYWRYIIVDEGQRIKNHESLLARELYHLKSYNRLILTGTPLQNNLTELWALLHFLLPDIFHDSGTFKSLFEIEDLQDENKIIEQEKDTHIISTIHGVLKPFMLRRLKADVLTDMVPKKEVIVYCPMTDEQKKLYKFVLENSIELLLHNKPKNGIDIDVNSSRTKRTSVLRKSQQNEFTYADGTDKDVDSDEEFEMFLKSIENTKMKENVPKVLPSNVLQIRNRVTMQSPVTMFKKVTNHPYLVHLPYKKDENNVKRVIIDENVLTKSGKMMILDALLAKLKERGHKVLLFSTMCTMLDLIEDYLEIKDYKYERLDGSVTIAKREASMKNFQDDKDIFLFLISTRAGGLGLNLVAADTVIIFDCDWNPQVDIQAQDRCHRIGQTKPVVVYKFITKNTIDEKILSYGTAKRRLEKVVMKKDLAATFTTKSGLEELRELLNSEHHKNVMHPNGFILSDDELNKLVDRSDLYAQMKTKK